MPTFTMTNLRKSWWITTKVIRSSLRIPARANLKLSCPQAYSEESFIKTYLQKKSPLREFAVDLGCGSSPANTFLAASVLGIDLIKSPGSGVISSDLITAPIPLESNSVDIVSARNFIEHVPRVAVRETTTFPFINLMNEIYRVLRPNGILYSRTPAFPMQEAFQDPTHVNIITERTFPSYFCTLGC